METLKRIGTDTHPFVTLDKENGIFQFTGVSTPDSAEGFYHEIVQWVENYVANPNPTTKFTFHLDYFNITTSKRILFMLYSLEALANSGKSEVSIEWMYEEGDDDMLEAGQDFEHMMTHISFIFTELERQEEVA